MNIDDVKRTLQRHLTSGIVIVVGSGLSCAEGLPGMDALAGHLAAADPGSANPPIDAAFWASLIAEIKAKGLEPALKEIDLSDPGLDFIRTESAKCIVGFEHEVIREVITEGRILRFSRLLPHLPNDERFSVITTNYDRLIELAAETAGFLVDTRARGFYCAPFSKTDGAFAFAKKVVQVRGGFRKVEEKCFSLYKPHGSLDWLESRGRSVRTAFDLGPDHALIVTPGRGKYRAGYNQPFDMHRELANEAIDRAARLFLIGYGFNDDHLETHLSARIKSGTPTVIMARTLTPNAMKYLHTGASVWALEADPATVPGTIVHNGTRRSSVPAEDLWDVTGFVTGVMGA